MLCEPVPPPNGELEHIHYFCGNSEIPDELVAHEPQRVALYKATAALMRAFANIVDDLEAAGYIEADIQRIKARIDQYLKLREIIRQASGETIDLKAYEADMRHLIDTYIQADAPRTISPFGDIPLMELIVKSGIAGAINELPDGIKGDRTAVAETIENNVRSKIIKDHLNDPAYFEKMSALLAEIIASRKAKAIDYEEYLRRIADLVKRVQAGQGSETPAQLTTPGRRAVYNNLKAELAAMPEYLAAQEPPPYGSADADRVLELALRIDASVKTHRPDGWRGIQAREQVVKKAIYDVLLNIALVERIFLIIKQQGEY